MMLPRAMLLALGTALAAVGLWWLLPGSTRWWRALGGVLALVGFGFLGSQVPVVGDWCATGMFYAIAAGTMVAAVATISCRSPVYCAIWFGMTLTATAGLFLLAGAEFLAVATIVVYAGAILVTFLFVLMLSQPEGHTSYDRRSWEPMLSAFTGAVLVGILSMMIGSAITQADAAYVSDAEAATPAAHGAVPAAAQPVPPTIARLGAELFTRYLVAVEAAGALLFAALVGAAVIVTQGRAAMKPPAPAAPGPKGDAVHAS